jgi:hypothetical protein
MRALLAILIVAALCGLAGPAQAQEWFWGLAWGVTYPQDDLQEFAGDQVFYRNISLEGRKIEYGSSASVGLSFGWQVMDNEVVDTVELGQDDQDLPPGDLTGTQFRYLNIFPLLANGHLYLGRPYSTRLFFGVNAGAFHIKERIEMGIFVRDESHWVFGGAPEVGIAFPTGATAVLFFNARYYITAANSDLEQLRWAQVSVGIAGQ